MFEDEQLSTDKKEPTDYTGLKIVAILAPLFFLFVYVGKAEMGFTACIVLGMIILAVKIRWNLRKHAWFWIIIGVLLLLHVPLLSLVRWPATKVPTIVYSLPIGISDFLLTLGAIQLGEKLFSNDSSSS